MVIMQYSDGINLAHDFFEQAFLYINHLDCNLLVGILMNG